MLQSQPHIKHPAEKGLLSHVQFVRELLDTKVLDALLWIDTRDMLADGLTKGAVDRWALHECMDGKHTFSHEFKLWSSKLNKTPEKLLEEHATSVLALFLSFEVLGSLGFTRLAQQSYSLGV